MGLAISVMGAKFESMTDWQQRYLDGDTPWEKGAAAPPLRELIEKLGAEVFGDGEVWVPGCGHGHDVRLLASHGLQVRGVDLAPAALEAARAHPPAGKEGYEQLDFLDADQMAGRAAGSIWEHTCFCAIDPSCRQTYARRAAELLAPGSVLAGVFFLNPYDPGEEALGPPHGSTAEEIEACFAPYFERVADWQPEAAYPGREGREWLAVYQRLT